MLGVKAKPAEAGRYARLDPCARFGPSAAMSFADRPGLAAGPGQQNSWSQAAYCKVHDPLSAPKGGSKIDEATITSTGSIATCGNTDSHPDCRAARSLTVWVTPDAIAAWHPARTGRPGRSAHYSDLAIETGVMLRLAFARPWRQTEGLLGSVTTLLGLSLDVPDHTTLSRRSAALSLVTALAVPAGPVTVVIDSTGLKVFGAGEWQMAKHGGRDRRTWRKLHLAIDPDTGEVLASALTTTEEGDVSLVRPLLDQIAAPIAAVLADGAYDGVPVYRAVADRAPAATVIIPPRATAVVSEVSAAGTPTPRDRHIEMIAAKGRLGWQKAVGYGRRSLVETGMLRYKTIIGRTLRARTLPAQKVEARVGCKVLNRMTALGMPVSRRLA